MTKYFPAVCLIPFLALFIAHPLAANAEPPANPQTETGAQSEKKESESEVTDLVEKFLRSAPHSEIRKLQDDAKKTQAAADLTKYFRKSAINRHIVFHIKVETAEATPEARNAFRIGPKTVPVKWEGGTMDLLSWLYFPNRKAPELASATVGSEITVAGAVRRCEIVVTPEGLRFDFDLWQCTIEHRK